MMKKFFINLALVLSFSILLFTINSPVFSEQLESKATIRIVNDTAEVPENSNKDDPEKNKEEDKNNLPKTNEVIKPSISLVGVILLFIGILGVYINNRKNGEQNNEKN